MCVIGIKLCMMVVLVGLYPFVPLPVPFKVTAVLNIYTRKLKVVFFGKFSPSRLKLDNLLKLSILRNGETNGVETDWLSSTSCRSD